MRVKHSKHNFITLALLTSLPIVLACSSGHETEEKDSASAQGAATVVLTEEQYSRAGIAIDTVSWQSISGTLELSGLIDVPPQNLASISMPLGGYVKEVKLLPGMPVKKGEIIATLEDQQYIQLQQDYLVQQAQLQQTEAEWKRQQLLASTQASSSKNLEQAEAAYKTSKATLQGLAARLRLIHIDPAILTDANIRSTAFIYAPFSGFVTKVNVNTGKYVAPSDVLFELVNPSDIHLNLKVFERDLPYLKKGQPLIAFTNAQPQKRYNCSVLLISKLIPEERAAEVHCHFNQYDPNLVPGMFMNAEVVVDRKNVPALPEEAIVLFESKHYVFVQTDERKYEMTAVRTGASANGFQEIIDWPLAAQKPVVVKGAYTLLMMLKNVAEE